MPTTAPAAGGFPATLVTLELDLAPARLAFDEFSRRTGIPFDEPPRVGWTPLDEKTVTLRAIDQPLWVVLRELCGQVGASEQQMSPGRFTLFPQDRDFDWRRIPTVVHGPFLVSIAGSGRDARLTLGRKIERDVRTTVWLTVEAEPGVRGLLARELTDVRFIDDAGRPIAPVVPEFRRPVADFQYGSAGLAVQIDPDPAAQRVARMVGTVRVVAQTAAVRVEVPDLMHARGREVAAGGLRFVFDVKPAEGGCDVTVDVIDPRGNERQWEETRGWLMGAAPRVFDAAGRELRSTGGGSSPGPVDGLSAQRLFHFRANPFEYRIEPADLPGTPARLVWDVPTEVREVELPFDFRDLPLP